MYMSFIFRTTRGPIVEVFTEMFSRICQTKTDLEQCMDQWKDFETWHERCAAWLKDLETRLRDIDLKATLPEKQAQLQKLKVRV